MKFSVFQVSRKGGREKNEDRMGYCFTRKAGIFLLADGMGGHPEGEVAAQMALQSIAASFQKEAKPEIADVAEFLQSALMVAHRQILHYAAVKGMLDSPRTTIVVALVQGSAVTWIHCGDSRLYVVRDGALQTRTRDHSFIEQRHLRLPVLSDTQRLNRNVLFTCLGSPTKPVFDIAGPLPLLHGDKLMLCSDGLWDSLNDSDIVYHLGHQPVGEAVPELVEKALRNAGNTSDNVTAIGFEWQSSEQFEPARGSISTDTISDGGFSSTFQAGWQDSGDDDLDDAAIERSIAEINEAIRRTAAKRN